ncbi:hypothetical protein F8M41_008920 [Gigaspora margarita]|uniref:Uncharacterized protein n=1 Tax=Gigaspora margarita TaxID=4874 RepID=A0A8H3X2T2_GIGMA|nr:hypothetical protein F8M41_008920 [Gigaspora margarita]
MHVICQKCYFDSLNLSLDSSNGDELDYSQGKNNIFASKSTNGPKKLREEVEGLRKELETVKTKLNGLEQANNAVLNLNSMRMELDQKDEYFDELTKQVSELKLVNEENNNLIKNLENEIQKLTGNIEEFRNNFKMAADYAESRYKIAVLESWLGIVLVEESDTDSPHLMED